MGSGPAVSSPESGKSKKALAILIAVIAVVAVVGLAVTVIVLSSDKATEPEKVFMDYSDFLLKKDAGGMYNTTIWGLNQSLYADWYNWLHWNDETSMHINSLNTTYRTDMTTDEKQWMDLMVQTIEDLMDVDIQEACLVGFNITVTVTDEGHSETDNYTDEVPLVKIAGKWYLVMMLDDLEDLLAPVPVTPAATLGRMAVTGGQKITILSISQPDVTWGDVIVLLADESNGTTWTPFTIDLNTGTVAEMNYSSELLSGIEVCCTITDLQGNGVLSQGDYIVFFTYGGDPTFISGIHYSVTLVYEPTGGQIASIQFTA